MQIFEKDYGLFRQLHLLIQLVFTELHIWWPNFMVILFGKLTLLTELSFFFPYQNTGNYIIVLIITAYMSPQEDT